MTAPPSAKYGIPRVADNDTINTFPVTQRAGIDWIDANISTFITTSPRPAAQYSGRWHLDLVTGVVSLDTGTAWVEMARVAAQAQVPLGTQVAYTGAVLPVDGRWQWADGGLISTTDFAEYFALVGHAYNGGVDPGGGNFRKPDKRGRAAVGADAMPGSAAAGRLPNSNRAFGQNGGAEQVTLTTATIPTHNHTATGSTAAAGSHSHGGATGARDRSQSHWHSVGGGQLIYNGGVGTAVGPFNVGGNSYLYRQALNADWAEPADHLHGISADGSHTHTTTVTVANNGSGGAHVNMQPYEVDNVIVRVR